MSRLHRGNTIRDNLSHGCGLISKSMERKIVQGEVVLQPLDVEQCFALMKTLQLLIDTAEVDAQENDVSVEYCQNTTIVYSQQIIQQLSEQRYKERLDGISVANSVQYIRFRPDYLQELPEELWSAIISVLVALVVDYIAKSRNTDQEYLIKWGISVLKRIGKLFKVNDIMLDALIKPVTQYATLKELKVDIDGVVRKDAHLQAVHEQLQKMQPELDQEFQKSVEEARNYLNNTEQIGNVGQRPDRGLLNTISKKINRVITRAMEPTVSASHREAEEHDAEEYTIDDGLDAGEPVDAAEEDVEMEYDFNLNDELLLESVPACAVLLRNLVTGCLMSGYNDSRVQLLFQDFSAALGMSTQTVLALENYIAAELVSAIRSTSNSGTTKRVTRNLKIAAVAAGGGALIALSAGVASPAVAAGIAVLGIGGGGMSGLLATTEEAELLASVFGVGSTGLVGWKNKKVSSKTDVEFCHINEQSGRSLAVCIGICGTLVPEVDVLSLWEEAVRAPLCDFYSMQWEIPLLRSLGSMAQVMENQQFAESAALLWQKMTRGEYLACGIQWPLPLVHFAQPLEMAWTIAKQKAKLYGVTLAQAIMDRQAAGERPISLVGYSIGARVIVYALLKLNEKQKLNIVKDVVLMGLPSTLGSKEWLQCCSVVAGRLINVYSRHDWLLGYLYRYLDPGVTVAGLRPVISEKVENYDATDFIKTHHNYMSKISDILTLVHVDL
ncbi:putative membrane protein -like protein [Babesia sp. Xinjiang]|uniref:putative membrane protein -like protein n=1 Tax=Babesia sp. Xinjiang TaxID=462227 RepID=UPI000A22E73C|nr:putative membrane protein -like protein [Babesia sp. Xinjiang]ORM41285.1 putative membrane protein -like protein [Babesia sp. Xinjiang]